MIKYKTWNEINWKIANYEVQQIQQLIVYAIKKSDFKEIYRLQKKLNYII